MNKIINELLLHTAKCTQFDLWPAFFRQFFESTLFGYKLRVVATYSFCSCWLLLFLLSPSLFFLAPSRDLWAYSRTHCAPLFCLPRFLSFIIHTMHIGMLSACKNSVLDYLQSYSFRLPVQKCWCAVQWALNKCNNNKNVCAASATIKPFPFPFRSRSHFCIFKMHSQLLLIRICCNTVSLPS